MSALIAALYKDHATAVRIRTSLVTGGFATDRVQLTSREEPGPAGLAPSNDTTSQLEEFFTQAFPDADEAGEVRAFVEGVKQGNAALVIHPRGEVETKQAKDVLSASNPLKVREHDLANQTMERAASHPGETMVGTVVPEGLKRTLNPRKN